MRDILKQLFGEEAVTDDIIKQFNAELGKKFVAKADFNSKLEENKTLKGNIAELTEKVKNGEEIQTELTALKAQIEADTKKAESDRVLKEKLESDERLFKTAVGDKKFSHGAVEKHYFELFRESLAKDENKEKSANDILKELTQNDETAFAGVTPIKLVGGTPQVGTGKIYESKKDILSIKDSSERQKAIANNINLFKKE